MPTELIVDIRLLLLTQTPPEVVFNNVVVAPKHTVVAPEVSDIVGKGFTVTKVADDVAEQLFTSVTVTVLFAVVLIDIVCVVSPVSHNHALPVLAVKLTELPEQNVVAPPALIVAVGNTFTFIIADPFAVLVQFVELLSCIDTKVYVNVPVEVVTAVISTKLFPPLVVAVCVTPFKV